MTKLDLHYVDPRLVALYDTDNPRGPDTDFYLQLATDLDARTILDFGCGSGRLTVEFAVDGRRVIGVDPSRAMLGVARRKLGADRVRWVEGDSSALGAPAADLAVMTGNVAQVFLEDSDWSTTLSHIRGALRPGGHLGFESRNPSARAWERWNREDTYERIDSPNGPMECWLELVRVADGRVQFEGHNVFRETGEVVIAPSELRFRTLHELTDSLTAAGFVVEQVYGDWDRGPVADTSPLLVVVSHT